MRPWASEFARLSRKRPDPQTLAIGTMSAMGIFATLEASLASLSQMTAASVMGTWHSSRQACTAYHPAEPGRGSPYTKPPSSQLRFLTGGRFLFSGFHVLSGCTPPFRYASMSSIKRDVKKKAPPRPEDRGSFSRSSPPCFVTLKIFGLLSHSRKLSRLLVAKFECERRGKQDECQPWFYPRLVAYRYFWLSEGA